MLVSVDHEFDNFCVCTQCSAIREGLKTEEYYQRLDRFISAANTLEAWAFRERHRQQTEFEKRVSDPKDIACLGRK